MVPGKLELTVVTPHGHLLHTGTEARTRRPGIVVDEVTAPGILGEFGVLPGHLPFLTYLRAGPVTFREANEHRYVAVRGGLAEVGPHKVILLADAAELAEEIDIDRAKNALERAARKLESGGLLEDPTYQKAMRKYERALVRLAVAERARKV
jgi:F-type H+-transporting ATPase subunit epsilon